MKNSLLHHPLKEKILTEVEQEMMNILWKIEPCSIHQIIENLPKNRELAYTSVATIIRILEQKEFLKSDKENKFHVYSSKITKEEYEKKSLSHLAKNVFDNKPLNIVKCLFNSKNLSKNDLHEIQKLLDENS